MTEERVDFQRLAKEAAAETYSPRAQRCWLWHQWTMWETKPSKTYNSLVIAQRSCIRCGRPQFKEHWLY
jgi:hypothetical protein